MKLRICKCQQCKYAKSSNWGQAKIKRVKRHNRQQCRLLLKSNKWELIEHRTIGVYTG